MQSITGPSMQKTIGLMRMFLYWQSNFSSLRCRPISNFGVTLFLFRHENGDDVMERINCLGDSLLHWAAYFGIHQLLEWLVSSGQDIDFAAALGTPLSAAMSSWAKCGDYMRSTTIPKLQHARSQWTT